MTFSGALATVPYSITSLWPDDVSNVLASSALPIFWTCRRRSNRLNDVHGDRQTPRQTASVQALRQSRDARSALMDGIKFSFTSSHNRQPSAPGATLP